MMTLYGIPNCETVKKARVLLDSLHVSYQFHDYKKQGADMTLLKHCCEHFGFEQVVNQRGTTWRQLDDEQRSNLTVAKALRLMQQQPSLIKRPILASGRNLLLGFDEKAYRKLAQSGT